MQTVSSGSGISASEWNKIVSNFITLDSQITGFESAEIALTQTTSMAKSAAHGLGTRPKRWQAVLRCKTAEAGYSAGDEIDVTSGGFYNWYGYYTSADTTNVTWAMNGTISVVRKGDTGFTNGNVSAANWVLVLRAWK